MYIIPAIDLRQGRCVRLIQGRYDRQISYSADPPGQAEDFISQGAEWLHIVDLDGAKAGKPINTDTIAAIAALRLLKIQVGGGIRTEEAINELLNLGIDRVIIGTKAVTDFDWFCRIAETYTNRIVLSLDARGRNLATQGWTSQGTQPLLDFAVKAAELPIAAIIYTDIDRDGMLSGPNLERTKALAEAVDTPVIAAGGINTVADITSLAKLSIEAAIIGRSLYEGTLTVRDAIAAANSA